MLTAVILCIAGYLLCRFRGCEIPRALRFWPLHLILLYTVLRAVERGTDRVNTLIASSAVLILLLTGGIPFAGELIGGMIFLTVAGALLLRRHSGNPGEMENTTYSALFDSRSFTVRDCITDGSVLFALFGSLKYDGSGAACEQELLIDVTAILGEVSIRLPDGCRVRVQETPLLGSVKHTQPGTWSEGKDEEELMYPEITVRALAVLGEVKIR